MLSPRTVTQVAEYWGQYFGCPADSLFASPCQIVTHDGELTGYAGVFGLYRNGGATVSFPPEQGFLREALGDAGSSASGLADALRPHGSRIVGPAYIGYTETITANASSARALTRSDLLRLRELQAACSEEEWEHGGSPPDASAISGVFVGETLASVASYELWDHWIAQISVVTHPAFRGFGHGRRAVAHVAARALASSRLPQYRTLDANIASRRIADSLGFSRYATSVAVRLAPLPDRNMMQGGTSDSA